MRTLEDMLFKQLQNDEFRKEYESIQPEIDVIRISIDARIGIEKDALEEAD